MQKNESLFEKNRGSTKVSCIKLNKERFIIEFPAYSSKRSIRKNRKHVSNSSKTIELLSDDCKKSFESDENPFKGNSTREQTYKFTNHIIGLSKSKMDLDNENTKSFDDWNLISDHKSEIKIKSLTVFASYYIIAISVVYVEADLTEKTSMHSCIDVKYLDRPDYEKCTLSLESDEYINYLSYLFSSQNGYIRSLQIGTTGGQLMVLEGQIELNNMTSDGSDFSSVLTGAGQDKERPSMETMPADFSKQTNTLMSFPKATPFKSQLMLTETNRHKYREKAMRTFSVAKPNEKIMSLDLVPKSQRLVGFKTHFGHYLRTLELYTEP